MLRPSRQSCCVACIPGFDATQQDCLHSRRKSDIPRPVQATSNFAAACQAGTVVVGVGLVYCTAWWLCIFPAFCACPLASTHWWTVFRSGCNARQMESSRKLFRHFTGRTPAQRNTNLLISRVFVWQDYERLEGDIDRLSEEKEALDAQVAAHAEAGNFPVISRCVPVIKPSTKVFTWLLLARGVLSMALLSPRVLWSRAREVHWRVHGAFARALRLAVAEGAARISLPGSNMAHPLSQSALRRRMPTGAEVVFLCCRR